jgi:hypothetical protein
MLCIRRHQHRPEQTDGLPGAGSACKAGRTAIKELLFLRAGKLVLSKDPNDPAEPDGSIEFYG